MEIVSTTSGTSTSAAVSKKPEISSDFETFLKMLTVQMQNQDPLNPVDSSDYAVQLATFSGVEQQVQTNDLLRGLTAQLGTTGMAQMAAWVGKEARAAAPAQLNGQPITLFPNPANGADHAEVVVRDAAGTEMQRFAIPVGTEPVQWAGVSADGYAYPSGLYAFDVVSYQGTDIIAQEPAETYSTVTEVRRTGGETQLVLSGGTMVTASQVTALRESS